MQILRKLFTWRARLDNIPAQCRYPSFYAVLEGVMPESKGETMGAQAFGSVFRTGEQPTSLWAFRFTFCHC